MPKLTPDSRRRILTIVLLLEHYELALRGIERLTSSVEEQNTLASAYGYIGRAASGLRGRFVP